MNSRKEARNAALGVGLNGPAQGRQLAHANSPFAPRVALGAGDQLEPVTSTSAPELRPRVMSGAVGAVSRTLDQFQHDMQAAKDLVASGARVIELEPSDVEESILKDRLELNPENQAVLVDSIQRSGQQVPILVRQISESPARYQVAYGHRRVAACRQLSRKVLAIVRSLTDQELLVAQGQENSSRTDLSYIERAVFSLNLEERGVPRETIMLALTTDKTELSKMITVARMIPADIVRAIGPAPKAGRTRWLGLSQRLSEVKLDPKFRALLGGKEFGSESTDARFELVFKFLQAKPKRGGQSLNWATSDGKELVRGVRSPKAMILTIDERQEPGFGEFLFENLNVFYEKFRTRKTTPDPE